MNWLQILLVLLYFTLFGSISWCTRHSQHKKYPLDFDTVLTVSFILSTIMLLLPLSIGLGLALGNAAKIWTWLGGF